MDALTYKYIHYIGIFILMFSLGSLFTKYNKCAVIAHGISLLLIILGGFGMQAKYKETYEGLYQTGFPTFMIIKIVIWLMFGASVVLAKREIVKGSLAWLLMIGLGATAAYLGLYAKVVSG